jgi:hypothetical protein
MDAVLNQAVADFLPIANAEESSLQPIANLWAAFVGDDGTSSNELPIEFPHDRPYPKVVSLSGITIDAHLQLTAVLGLVQTFSGRVPHDFVVRLHLMKCVKI